MKKKIFIVFDQLPKKELGGLVYTYTQLIPLLSEKYQVEVISVFESGFETFCGCKVRNLIPYKANVVVSDFKKFIEKKKYVQALNIPFSAALYFAMEPIAKKKVREIINRYNKPIIIAVSPAAATFIPKRIPFILEIHVKYEYFFQGSLIPSLQTKLMGLPSLTLFRSQRDMEQAPKTLNPGFVYNFVDETIFFHKKKIGSEERNKKILFMGRLEDVKDPFRLLDNAKRLKEIIGKFQLDLYGTGSLKDKLEQYIQENDLSNCVSLKGFIDDKQIYNDYALLWMTSKSEGFPVVAIEAKANGVPIISTNWQGGIQEVIHDGWDGYIVDSDEDFVERTIELLSNKEKLEKMSRNALQDFERFNSQTAKERWFYILEIFSNKQEE